MVRKQLYLEERQDRALKRRAKALGVSEADIVRQALDVLFDADRDAAVVPGHKEALRELLDRAAQFASAARERGARTAHYRREELYDEREKRWSGRS